MCMMFAGAADFFKNQFSSCKEIHSWPPAVLRKTTRRSRIAIKTMACTWL